MPSLPKPAMLRARGALLWVFLTFALHLAWEIAQLPFYTLWIEADWAASARAVVHCSLGDVSISAAVFALVAAVTRCIDWPLRTDWRSLLAITVGLAYTAWSEWLNVDVRGSWAYAPSMPVVADIGLLPLLQWLLVPPLSWLALRKLTTAR